MNHAMVNMMNNIILLLVIVPAIFLLCINSYIKNVKDGIPEARARKISWNHGLMAAFFFAFGYVLRFLSDGTMF